MNRREVIEAVDQAKGEYTEGNAVLLPLVDRIRSSLVVDLGALAYRIENLIGTPTKVRDGVLAVDLAASVARDFYEAGATAVDVTTDGTSNTHAQKARVLGYKAADTLAGNIPVGESGPTISARTAQLREGLSEVDARLGALLDVVNRVGEVAIQLADDYADTVDLGEQAITEAILYQQDI